MNRKRLIDICKIICLILCACFLLSACSDSSDNSNKKGTVIIDTKGSGEDIDSITASHHSVQENACWQGAILRIMYKDIGAMTTSVYKTLTSENLWSLVILAFTIWMAWQILKHVSSTTPESIGEFWTKILQKAAICMICGMLASSPENILYAVNNFIFPIYITILEFTSEIMENLGKSPEAKTAAISLLGLGNDEPTCELFVTSISSCKFNGAINVSMSVDQGFPTEPLELMSCMTCVIAERLGMGFDIGLNLLTTFSFTAIVTGIFILAIFFITWAGFAIYLIDSIFRLNMMVIIMPFLIMFFAFEQTRKWSIKGLQIILSSAAIMMCLGLIVTMTIFAMEKLLTDDNMRVPYGSPEAYMDMGTVALSILFMAFVIKEASASAVKLASHVTGYSGEAGFAKKLKSVIQWAGGIFFAIITWGASSAWSTAYKHSQGVRKIQHAVEKVQNKIRKAAGRGSDEEDE